ncbi:hypothetical protein GCM10008940_21560 [Microbulbifer agarilyticus]
MSEKIAVRYAEDVCCPHCIKLFPLADGLLRSPMWLTEARTDWPVISVEPEGSLVLGGTRASFKSGGS